MPDVVLTTLNARYAHASFGLRYLMANLPPAVRRRAEMLEFDISQRAVNVLEAILARSPRIVSISRVARASRHTCNTRPRTNGCLTRCAE